MDQHPDRHTPLAARGGTTPLDTTARRFARPGNAAWVIALGSLLLLPQLGSFGLWDPVEIQHADVARDALEKGSLLDVTVGGTYAPRAVLPVWLVAAGFKVLGTSELAARLPLAIVGLLGLLVAFRLGKRLVDERAGLAATFVLATCPGYLLQSRQLGGEVVLYVGLLAAVGGLLSWVMPADGRRSWIDLALGGVGLVAGSLSGGLLVGWLFPVIVSGLSLRLIGSAGAEPPTPAEGAPTGGVARSSWHAAWPGLWTTLLLSLGLVGLVLLYAASPVGLRKLAEDGSSTLVWPRQGVWLVLGGSWRPVEPPPSFDLPLRRLGYLAFPWIGVLPIALGGFILRARDSRIGAPERLLGTLVVVSITLGYLVTVVASMFLGPHHFAALPLIALGVGVWLSRAGEGWSRAEPIAPYGALVAAGVLAAIQQDFSAEPSTLALSHLLEDVQFPLKLDLRVWVRAFGLVLPACAFVALAAPGASTEAWWGGERWYGRASKWVRPVMVRVVRWTRLAALLLVLGFAAWMAHWLTPQLSLHMSNKALYQTYHRCLGEAKEAGMLGQYRTSGRGAAYYTGGQVVEIPSQADLLARLRGAERFFAVIPADQLGTIDQAARQQRVSYYVLDARSSKALIISNQLGGACNSDKNPLRELVRTTPPAAISKRVSANFENRVELIGAAYPDVVRSGSSFKITLYFHVLDAVPANYKIFLHFDKPASRFHGDHPPLQEMYPTQYWLRGDYIVDTHEVDLPLLTTAPGVYQIYAGFWLGSKRLKVVSGPNDGSDRVPIGQIHVRVY